MVSPRVTKQASHKVSHCIPFAVSSRPGVFRCVGQLHRPQLAETLDHVAKKGAVGPVFLEDRNHGVHGAELADAARHRGVGRGLRHRPVQEVEFRLGHLQELISDYLYL